MEHKETVYLDTSVPSAYYDDKKPERMEMTRDFWKRLAKYEVCISQLVREELKQVEDVEQRGKMIELVTKYKKLDITNEVRTLGKEYIKEGIFPEKFESDALHVAVATINNINYIVSWNFRHLVKVKTRRLVNLVNGLKGYKPVEIVSPPEI